MIRTRTKIIERLKSSQVDRISEDKQINLSAHSSTRPDKLLMNTKHLEVSVAGTTLIHKVNFDLYSNDKIALI